MKRFIAGFALSALCIAAQAYEFTFVGQVTYTDGSLSGVSTGSVFEGHFSASSPGSAYGPIAPPRMASYRFATGQVTALIGGHSILAGSPSISISDNRGGNVEDGFSMSSGYPLDIDGVRYASGAFGFNLTTRPGTVNVIQGLQLPDQIDVAAFNGHSSLTYGYLQRNGAPGGTVLGFAVTSISMVPEPTSTTMLGVGALLVAALCRRRERRA